MAQTASTSPQAKTPRAQPKLSFGWPVGSKVRVHESLEYKNGRVVHMRYNVDFDRDEAGRLVARRHSRRARGRKPGTALEQWIQLRRVFDLPIHVSDKGKAVAVLSLDRLPDRYKSWVDEPDPAVMEGMRRLAAGEQDLVTKARILEFWYWWVDVWREPGVVVARDKSIPGPWLSVSFKDAVGRTVRGLVDPKTMRPLELVRTDEDAKPRTTRWVFEWDDLDVWMPTQEDLKRLLPPIGTDVHIQLDTDYGPIDCVLFPEAAPATVANFLGLARGKLAWRDPVTLERQRRPFYANLPFHRIVSGFVVQTGKVGWGSPGPGWSLRREVGMPSLFDAPGALGQVTARGKTSGSQFFVTAKPAPHLAKSYTAFGRCDDLNVVRKMAATPLRPNAKRKPVMPVKAPRLHRVIVDGAQ